MAKECPFTNTSFAFTVVAKSWRIYLKSQSRKGSAWNGKWRTVAVVLVERRTENRAAGLLSKHRHCRTLNPFWTSELNSFGRTERIESYMHSIKHRSIDSSNLMLCTGERRDPELDCMLLLGNSCSSTNSTIKVGRGESGLMSRAASRNSKFYKVAVGVVRDRYGRRLNWRRWLKTSNLSSNAFGLEYVEGVKREQSGSSQSVSFCSRILEAS